MTDADKDGLDDNYDASTTLTTTTASQGLTAVNIDSDSKPDYLDLDSDNDAALDVNESGIPATTTATYADVNGNVNIPVSDLKNSFGSTSEVNFREAGNDTDGDGMIDSLDIDDDNDGILDVNENVAADGVTNGGFVGASADGWLLSTGTVPYLFGYSNLYVNQDSKRYRTL